jgi:hypothetical protein
VQLVPRDWATRIPRAAVAGVAALIVSGCAAHPQARELPGSYTDTRIGEDLAVVSFESNAGMRKERMRPYVLYRCAQITQKYGYDYFVLGNIAEATDKPGSHHENQDSYFLEYAAGAPAHGGGNSASGPAQASGSGATSPIRKSGTEVIIKMFKGKTPPNNPRAYDAQGTIRSLGP